jgi:biotin carboxyl carrier protein
MSEEKKPEESGHDQGNAQTRQPTDSRRSNNFETSGGSGEGRHGSRRRHRGDRDSRQQSTAARRAESSINMDELRELADLIVAQGFTEFELEKEGFRLRLSRNTYSQTQPTQSAPASVSAIPFPAMPTAATPAGTQTSLPRPDPQAQSASLPAAGSSEADELYKITSPIVGTFYRAPSPTADVFVNQGSRVEADTVVCIIEAMKLMNEIQAEVSGTVEKIYVENGQPVEYGQALFGIKK